MLKRILFSAFILTATCFSVQAQNPVNKTFTLRAGKTEMVIDSAVGARIISYKLNGKEILSSAKIHPQMYGSTFWLSPEDKWRRQGILDSRGYTLESFNGSSLHLKSRNDNFNGFSYSKKFHVNRADKSIVIQYGITNISQEIREVAPWENTRVPAGGLALFPKRSAQDNPTTNKTYPLPLVRDSIGVIWYPYDSLTQSAQKLFMHGGEGWIAYVHNRILFVKKIPLITPDQTAPGEKNVEMYVNPEKTYVEMENQGPYQKLMKGESLSYEVKWYARPLPRRIKVEIGNQALLNYIRKVVK